MQTGSLREACRGLARGRVLAVAVVAGVAAALVGVSPGMASAGRANVSSFPTRGGILFGGTDGLAKQTAALGRNLAIVRVYYHIGNTFPVYVDAKHMKEGSTLLVSLDSKGQSYSSIAAGQYDTTISAFLTAMNQAAITYKLKSIFISFEHEADSSQHASLGTSAQFIAAWDHVRQLAASANLDWDQHVGGRLMWTLILTRHAYTVGTNADGYWPGAGETDVVAADGYNSYGCGNAALYTPAQLFNPLLHFAKAHGKLKVIIAEWGSNAAQPSAQAQFITEMQTYLTDHHKHIKAADYWDDAVNTCSYKVDGNPGSLAALKTLGASPVMQGTARKG